MNKNLKEIGKGIEKVNIMPAKKILDRMFESAVWKIGRWVSEEDRKVKKIYSQKEALKLFGMPQFTEIKGNLLLNSGIDELFTLICSGTGTEFDNVNAEIGVGNGTAAAAATQTGLQGTSTFFKGMMSGFPTYGSNQKATWKSEFAGTDANFAWEEFVVRNGATAAKCLNRKVSSQGTKAADQIWQLTLEISLS